MKSKTIFLGLVFILSGLLLSACTGAPAVTSWPGITLDEQNVYVSNGQQVAAVRASDGSLAWLYPQDGDKSHIFYAPPEVAGNDLVVGSYQNNLYSINAQTGAQQWSFTDATGRFAGSALILEDLVLAPSADHTLYALDRSGKLVWQFKTGNILWAKPVSDGETIYLAAMDHFLYALDMNGNQIWKTDLGGAAVSSPVLSEEGALYLGTLGNELIAVNSADGKVLWRYAADAPIWSSPALHEESLFFGDSKGARYGLSLDGRELWKTPGSGYIVGTPAVFEKGLVFVNVNGEVTAVDFNGQALWGPKPVSGKLYTSPLVAGDKIIVASMQGDETLVSFDFNGNIVWSYPPK